MICPPDSPIPLSQKDLFNALNCKGEFLVLKLSYNDYEQELQTQKIMYKISQALSVIVSYEDDGKSYKKIEKFVKYINDISDEKQNSTFGIKKVKNLSEYPITILFSAILPINQLRMSVGKKLYEFIHSDDKYFKPKFQKWRDVVSLDIGVPLLPILPKLDTKLEDFTVVLIDLIDDRLISKFEVDAEVDKESIELYLLKLFYIYKVLAKEKESIK